MSGITTPTGRDVDYTVNGQGQVTTVSATYNSITKTLADNIGYLPFGPLETMTLGNGQVINRTFDQQHRLTGIDAPGTLELSYTHDATGNVTAIDNLLDVTRDKSFGYDDLYRLTSASAVNGDFGFTLDKVGNRETRTHDAAIDTYTYLTGTNQIDTVSGAILTDYTHDPAGNITAMGDRTLFYNQAGRLQRVEENTTILGEYVYNALGQRVTKTVGGVVTVFHYDFDGNLIGESASNGTFSKEYIHAMGNRFAMVDVVADKVYYYLNDHLGTPVKMTDETNAVVWEGTYTPFGLAEVSPGAQVENNFRFAGQYYDVEIGLHYNYHRYYDPKTGRYLTPDPIGLAGGINLYAYVHNDPINSYDPLGLIDDPVPGLHVTYVDLPVIIQHLQQVAILWELEPGAQNPEMDMIERLIEGEKEKCDIEFYMHEQIEAELVKKYGGYTKENQERAHNEAFKMRGITPKDIWHPSVLEKYKGTHFGPYYYQ